MRVTAKLFVSAKGTTTGPFIVIYSKRPVIVFPGAIRFMDIGSNAIDRFIRADSNTSGKRADFVGVFTGETVDRGK